jgi:hypothetical protein
MTVLSAAKRQELLAKKATLEDLLEEAYDSYSASISSQNKSYKFDSGEGMQSAVLRDLKEQRESIEWLEARIDYITRRLEGKLNVNLNVRRKQGRGLGRRFGRY